MKLWKVMIQVKNGLRHIMNMLGLSLFWNDFQMMSKLYADD